jgi:hypothetical protein
VSRRRAARARTSRRATIFDSDASNPYGRELAHLLKMDDSFEIVFCGPSDLTDIDARLSLRPRFSVPKLRDFVHEIRSLVKVAIRSDPSNPVVVVWARPYQKIVLAALAGGPRRRLHAIVHNPTSDRWPRGWRRVVEGYYLQRANRLVHSATLGDHLRKLTGLTSEVVQHPPYAQWVAANMPEPLNRTTGDASRGRLLIFGRYEPDKFRDLEALLYELDTVGSALELRILTRPHIDVAIQPKHLTIDNRSRNEWISDPELAEALSWADVLVAPYEGVTESGTVNLALTAGTRVVAFRGGALSEHLRPHALVEPADYKALAMAALEAASGPASTNRWTANDRAESARLSWLQALRSE